jgi:hypothetical protein
MRGVSNGKQPPWTTRLASSGPTLVTSMRAPMGTRIISIMRACARMDIRPMHITGALGLQAWWAPCQRCSEAATNKWNLRTETKTWILGVATIALIPTELFSFRLNIQTVLVKPLRLSRLFPKRVYRVQG